MAKQGSYPMGVRTLATGDTLTGVVTGATADVPIETMKAYTDGAAAAALTGAVSWDPVPGVDSTDGTKVRNVQAQALLNRTHTLNPDNVTAPGSLDGSETWSFKKAGAWAKGSVSAVSGYVVSASVLNPDNETAPVSLDGSETWSFKKAGAWAKAGLSAIATYILSVFTLVWVTGGTARALLAKLLDQPISVSDFGADPTGVADSTTAIQNAINFLTSGGIVYFPRGTYKFSALNVTAGVVLRGEAPYASVLLCSTTTGDVITLAVSAKIEDLKLTSSAARTAGRNIVITANGSSVRRVEMLNYYIGVDVNGSSGVATNAMLSDISFSSPSLTTGGCMILGSNYANLTIDKVVGAGPTSGTQPSYGVRLLNGDTCFINNTNITLHGAAFKPDPTAGQHVFATAVSNSFFDSASGHSCGEMTGAGNVYDTKIDNTWFGLASGSGNSGLLINPSGSGNVDGVALTGCEFPANADSGLRVNGTGAKNINVAGGWAAGNTYGYNFSGGCTHFMVKNVRAGNVSNRGPNSQYGIIVQSGASDYYDLSGNDLNGNTVGALSDSGTGTHKTTTPNLT